MVAAQTPSPLETPLHAVFRRIESLSPRSGRAGTVVTLRATGMPAITPVRIGLGATELGFEEIGQALTTDGGELSSTVTVPSWTRPDLTHVFIVFDFYFIPIAVSYEFFVLAPDGTVARQGRITNGVGDCPAPGLLTDESVLYTLVGDLSGFEAGDRVIVEGALPNRHSACRVQRSKSSGYGPAKRISRRIGCLLPGVASASRYETARTSAAR